MKRKLALLTAFLALTGAVALAVTINSLTAIVTIDGDEEFEVWDPDQAAGSESLKMTLTQILGWLDDQAWTYTQAIAFSGGVSSDTWLLNETTAPSTAASQGALWIDSSGVLYQRAESDGASTALAGLPIYTEAHAASHTLSVDAGTREGYGSVHYVTAASVTLTLPAVADGASFTVISNTANTVIVDADGSDLIILDGTSLDDGDSIDSAGAAGDIVTLTYYDGTGWFAVSNSWTDGGAS